MTQTLKNIVEKILGEDIYKRADGIISVPGPLGSDSLDISKNAVDGKKLCCELVDFIIHYDLDSGNELFIGTSSMLGTPWTSGSYQLDYMRDMHSILIYEKTAESDFSLELLANFWENSGEFSIRNHIICGEALDNSNPQKKATFYTEHSIADIMKPIYEAAFDKEFGLPMKNKHKVMPSTSIHLYGKRKKSSFEKDLRNI